MAQKSMQKSAWQKKCHAYAWHFFKIIPIISYSIGAPVALLSLITPLSSTKKIRVPVVPLTPGLAVQVY
jgi:hypothetical protein